MSDMGWILDSLEIAAILCSIKPLLEKVLGTRSLHRDWNWVRSLVYLWSQSIEMRIFNRCSRPNGC